MANRSVLTLVFSVLVMSLQAQFNIVYIGIDGLTCSACSFATQKSILTLDFVDTVVMDLNTTIAKITFKKNKAVSIDALSKKVDDAGFKVRSVQAIYDFNAITASENSCFKNDQGVFQFIGLNQTRVLGSNTIIKFIGSNYCSKREYKKWDPKIKAAKTCEDENKDTPHYFITL